MTEHRTKPLVVFVFAQEGAPTSTKYGGFARRLQKAGGLKDKEVLTVALENLAFLIRENKEAEVIDTVSGCNLAEASFVYMKAWGEETAALANFLFYKGVPFMDSAALHVKGSKLATAFRLWGAGLPVPFTLYVRRADRLVQFLESQHIAELAGKFIFKDANGAKGNLNFCIERGDLLAITAQHPDVRFICQRFIKNEGDYRVGIYGGTASFVIKRTGKDGSHLNNTSAGGMAEYMLVGQLQPKLAQLAQRAAAACELQVAGVDIIVDQSTGKPYVLEVNQGSQIVTGAFTAENITAFNEQLDAVMRGRYAKIRNKPMTIIGRRAIAKLPDLGVANIVAKIDTGAYTSSIHAEDVRIEGEELVFTIPSHNHIALHPDRDETVRVKDYFVQKVRSSNGQLQHRYSFRTTIIIERTRFRVTLTLSNRSEMGYPLLIGRRALRSRFLVNVELNEQQLREWKF